MKRALILGIGGQDGSYLADHLLSLEYEVHGTYRRSSVDNLARVYHVRHRLVLHPADLSDGASVERVLRAVKPNEVYNMADQDHVGFSRSTPEVSVDITAGAVSRLLESILAYQLDTKRDVKLFQPVSATMFGRQSAPQCETTPFAPTSPYACAKVMAYYLCQHYRREHGVFVSCGIMYNHDSRRRGEGYLIGRVIAQARKGPPVRLSNIDHTVDIGYAPEFVCAMHAMLQLDVSVDLVIGTGQAYSVRRLAELAMEALGRHDGAVEDDGCVTYDDEPTLIANVARAKSVIGFEPKVHGWSLIRKLME